MALGCRQQLHNAIFSNGPVFYWKGEPMVLNPHFRKIVERYWKAFFSDCIEWIHVAGIIPVMLVRLRDVPGVVIPAVPKGIMGRDFNIGVRIRGGVVDFPFVKLKSRRSGMDLAVPKEDTKVRVIGGFGYDPTPSGWITSPMSTMVVDDYFQNRSWAYELRAGYNRCNVEKVTQTTNESWPYSKAQTSHPYGLYGNMDVTKHGESAKYQLNQDEMAEAIQREMQNFVRQAQQSDTSFTIDQHARPPGPEAFHPLPPGHTLARQVLPEGRRDFVDTNRYLEWRISSAFGVPRVLLIADEARNAENIKVAIQTFNDRINRLKNQLGELGTEVYQAIYDEEDRIYAISQYDAEELSSMDPNTIASVVEEPRVTVGFPMIPNEDMDGLLLKFGLGILDWKSLCQLSKVWWGIEYGYFFYFYEGYQP
jgi:hypothetical protein